MNKQHPEHYAVLQLTSEKATTAQIKKAYHKLAKKYHPDKHPKQRHLAKEVMQQLNTAYSILSNVSLRKQYDADVQAQRDRLRLAREQQLRKEMEEQRWQAAQAHQNVRKKIDSTKTYLATTALFIAVGLGVVASGMAAKSILKKSS